MKELITAAQKIMDKLSAESVIFELDSTRIIVKVTLHNGGECTEIFDAWAVSAHTLDSTADKIIEEMKGRLT